jgi:integrase
MIYKRFNGKKVKKGDKNYDRATWYYRFTIRGKTYHQAVPEAKTLRKAQDAETAARNAIFNNRYGQMNDETTFNDFVKDVYLDYIKTHNVNTYSKNIFTKELQKYFGKMMLKEITPNDVRRYITRRKAAKTIHDRKRSNSSVNKELSTLSKIFNLAMQERKIDTNPTQFIEKLAEPKSRQRILSAEERERFFTELGKDKILYRLSMIAMHTGLRKGQILSLKLSDIDFEREVLTASPSKGREERKIPLNQTMVNLFKEIEAETPDGLIFPFKDFRKRWNNAMDEKHANIEDFTFHDLKHQFSTELVRRGVSPSLVQLLFAHSDIKITEGYINDELEIMKSALSKLDDVQIIEKMQ